MGRREAPGDSRSKRSLERRRADQERDIADRARFRRFLDLRQEAQLFAAVTGDQLTPRRLEKLRVSAHEALGMYARDPWAKVDSWTLTDSLPAVLSDPRVPRARNPLVSMSPL